MELELGKSLCLCAFPSVPWALAPCISAFFTVENSTPLCQNGWEMELETEKCKHPSPRPACFGDEVKFIQHMEEQASDSECAGCPSENECGEFILLKCSRELLF